MVNDYSQLNKIFGSDVHPCQLQQALTHRSYSYENNLVPHNERLEHLGDAVLQLVISEILFTTYPESPESSLTKMRANIVNTRALSETARRLGLGKYILLGNGEESQGGRDKDSILADTLEAVFGAIYQHSGYEKTFTILANIFAQSIEHASVKKYRSDWKTPLQELLAEKKLPTARYEIERFGPEHDSTFIAKIYISDSFYGQGQGSNRRAAEQQAAKIAWYSLIESTDSIMGNPAQ